VTAPQSPRELPSLTQPDGSVIVPAELAADVLRRLVRDIVIEARTTGGQPSPGARQLLDALHRAAHGSAAQRGQHEDHEHPPAMPGISVGEAAQLMGCTPQWVRAQLAAGKLAGRRSSGVWIVHTGQKLATSQAPQQSA
jgi:hypothetical protein